MDEGHAGHVLHSLLPATGSRAAFWFLPVSEPKKPTKTDKNKKTGNLET